MMLRAVFFTLSIISYTVIMASSSDHRKELGPVEALYIVNSDEKDKEIPKGHFIIEGTVRLHSSNNPLENAQVNGYNPESGKEINQQAQITDSLGRFSMMLPIGTEQFCAYHELFPETCISDFEFKDQHRIDIQIFIAAAVIKQQHTKRKPLVYLYSDNPMSAKITINPYGDFTFTYPKYEDSWEVTIDENGLVRQTGKDRVYPYLFWEAESPNFQLMSDGMDIPGFVIKTDSTIEFLESSLDQLNFNQREKTDFITYWAPIIERKEFALIQFMIDDDYEENVAQMDIHPKPESMRRVYMVVSSMDSEFVPYNIIPQELNSFERKGFTVVEWGGGTIDLQNMKP